MPQVPSPASYSVAAGLTWVAAAWTTVRYLRRRGDARLWAHWCTVVLLALSLTVAIPPVYLAVDRFLGLPNAACWITDALALGSAYMVDTFLFAVAHGAEQLRWHRPWLLAYLALTLATMAVLLWRTGLRVDVVPLDLPQVNAALVAYRLVFLAFLGFVVVRVIASAAYYRRHTPDPLVKVGMTLLLLGGLWGLSYLVSRLATALLPSTSPLARPLNLWLEFSVLMGIVCLALGTLVPQWGKRVGLPVMARHVSAMLAYWRLRPLWRQLSRARPEVVLPTAMTWHSALLRPHDMDFLMQRRVIEILDARRLLLPSSPTIPSPSPVARWSASTPWIRSSGPSRNEPHWDLSEAVGAPRGWSEMVRATPRAPNTSGGVVQHAHLTQALDRVDRMDRMAHVEAWLLMCRLRTIGIPSAGRLRAPGTVLFQPATYEESVSYLQQVAAAFRAYNRRSAWTHTSGPAYGKGEGEEWDVGEGQYA